MILYKDHWFWGSVITNKKLYSKVLIASVFINVFALVSALYIMVVYDRVVPNAAIESLLVLTIGILLVMLFDFIMKSLRGIYTDHASTAVDIEVSDKLFDQISRNVELGNQPVGSVASVIKEFEFLKEFIASASFSAFVDLPFIIFFLFVLYGIGGPVALVPALIVVLVITAGVLIQPIIKRLTMSSTDNSKSKHSVIVEILSGMEVLKSLRGINIIKKRWIDSVDEQGKTTMKSKFWSQLTNNIAMSGQQLSQVGIVFYGVFLVLDASLTMGSLIACVILSGRVLAPLAQISNLIGRFNQAISAYFNFGEIMDLKVPEISRTDQTRMSKITGSIDFLNASLTYPEQKNPVIDNLNLSIKENEKIAIIGKIGSGKTSLLRLITGVYDATGGSVKIGKADISHMHPDDIRMHIGVVTQTPTLFSGTLKENLLLGNPDATDEDILEAAKIAGVDHIAASLPDGFNTLIQEGGKQLSGGQRQAISIARAFVGNPKIIIMDEPSSAMDSASENRLLADLSARIKDKTFILITHRGALLSLINRVVVFDGGKIIADGPKDQILNPQKAVQNKESSE